MRKRLPATADFGELGCDVINVCVPTPLTRSKDPDVSHMASAMEEIRKRLRSGQLIVLGSTTYPGTTHELFVPMLESTGLRVGQDFALAFAPERIDPANRQFAVREVPKVVGGETALCCELARKLFESIFDKVVPVSSTQSAEMVKLLENTFRAINIGLVNEVAMMCDRLGSTSGGDRGRRDQALRLHEVPARAGPGGHCIPVDPTYLSWKMKSLNFPARFIDLATEINGQMPEHVADRVADLLNEDRIAVNGSRILILGAAYKANVSDVRESPALDVMKLLRAKGAEISYYDPHVGELELDGTMFKSLDLTDELVASQDLVVIVTDHAAVDTARVVARAQRVFDTRNATRGIGEGREKIRRL